VQATSRPSGRLDNGPLSPFCSTQKEGHKVELKARKLTY
jgi:hypothetical protein